MPYWKESINPTSGQRLREELKQKGYSHSQFADMVNLDPKVIGFYCQGRRRITEKRAEQFAGILGVRAEYLLGLDDFRTPDREWLRNAAGLETKKEAFFDHCLSFWGYEIIGNESIYSEDNNGDPQITGMSYKIKTPTGKEISVTAESVEQIENEILDFALFKIQSLR